MITLAPTSYDSTGPGTWAIGSEITAQYCQNPFYNSVDANGDNVSYKVYLDSGTYTFLLFGIKGTNRGIVDVDIDAAEVASFDLYAASTQCNQRLIQTGIVIASSGIKTLKLRVDGKNGSSSGYVLPFVFIALWRTA